MRRSGKRSTSPPSRSRLLRTPLAQTTSSASGHGLDLVHGLGDGCVGGHTIHIEDLVGPQTEEIQDSRREAGEALTEVEVQEVVQAPPEADGTVGRLLNPSPVPVREARSSLIEGQVQPSPPGDGPENNPSRLTAFRHLTH